MILRRSAEPVREVIKCRYAPRVEPRIFGLENEYGVTCTLRGQRRLNPYDVARYLFLWFVSLGRSTNWFLDNCARLYLYLHCLPDYPSPVCYSIFDFLFHD